MNTHTVMCIAELKYKLPRDFDGVIEIIIVRVDSGGYTEGGQYFGTGLPLYEVECSNHLALEIVSSHVQKALSRFPT